MTDRMTPEQRHRCMSSIRSKATRPELAVRRWLWQRGYRYRLNVHSVPGSPDIVMRPYRTAIFVNGCFWHGHNLTPIPSPTGEGNRMPQVTQAENGEWTAENSPCCKIPQSNRDYWLAKIRRNQERDARNCRLLQENGWQVIEVWECQLRPAERLEHTMRHVELMLHENLLRIHRTAIIPPESGEVPVVPLPAKPTPQPYPADDDSSLPLAAENESE